MKSEDMFMLLDEVKQFLNTYSENMANRIGGEPKKGMGTMTMQSEIISLSSNRDKFTEALKAQFDKMKSHLDFFRLAGANVTIGNVKIVYSEDTSIYGHRFYFTVDVMR